MRLVKLLKLLLTTPLLLFGTVACSAQTTASPFPSHSVSGPVTIDLSEVQVAVPYGDSEPMTVVSVCFSYETASATIQPSIFTDTAVLSVKLKKSASGWCGSVIVPFNRNDIDSVQVDTSQTVNFTKPAPKE